MLSVCNFAHVNAHAGTRAKKDVLMLVGNARKAFATFVYLAVMLQTKSSGEYFNDIYPKSRLTINVLSVMKWTIRQEFSARL